MQVLRADGQRIDLSQRDAGALLVATRQGWQADAFSYRDLIGEVRFAIRLLARHVARVRFYAAEQRDDDQDPASLDGDEHGLDSQLAADAVHNFSRIPFDGNPDGFTARLVENLSIAGEAWVHIDDRGRFRVRSVSEITASADGRVVMNLLPSAARGAQRQINPEREDLLRCWVPHPEWGELADSPLRVLRDTCEDVVLAGREQRAAARSRVAANGILLLPDSLSLVQQRQDVEAGDEDGIVEDSFMADFAAAMLAPVQDDGDASAVVPIVIRGAIEDLKEVRHVTLQRADAGDLIERQQTGLLRILKGLDIQPEQVDGVGATNHWTAWIIDSRSIRDQVQPTAETVAACLAQAFLRPALLSLGHDEDAVDRVMIAVDVSALAENPNRGQDARDAHASLAISDEALRVALGFDEDDAPDEDEFLRRIASSGRLPVELAAVVLGVQRPGQPVTINGETVPQQRALPSSPTPAAPAEAEERPQAGPGIVTPTNPTPAEPTQIVAAAEQQDDGWRVDVETSRRLADLDAALVERITVAADSALARVLERAGARVRSQAQKDRALAGRIGGLDAHLIPTRLGREQVEVFVPVADLLADGYARLRQQVTRWLTDAAKQTARLVLDLLGLRPGSPEARRVADVVTSRLAVNQDRAWAVLAERLDVAAERALFAPDPMNPAPELPGEAEEATLIRPREVVEVVAAAGGGDVARPGDGGMGTGPTVRDVLGEEGGAVLLGWEWQYRPELVRRTFLPHRALDGTRFATFTDPKLDTDAASSWLGAYFRPQDHDGCLCRAAPIWAVPDMADGIVARRLREAAGNPRNILAGQVATDDTTAGRVGTSLQNEVEVRDRITVAVERLRREHIERSTS